MGAVKKELARRYDSTQRRQQAQQNRARVLQAARQRFLAQGYAATKIAEIARDAGVSVETVYKTFATKAGVLKALFDVSVAGDDDPIPMAQREIIQKVLDAPEATRKIAIYAEHLASTMPRSAPVQLLARDGAASSADAAAVWKQIRDETLTAMKMFAADLGKTGQLRVSAAVARDVLWTYHAPELYELLVLERGWSAARYGEFITAALTDALLRR
ncbi:TetR/AcrR family transcriptional regulator [Mycobacterium paragordonae]|uniref:Helix-turn-helix domain-containing protein n=1 Tax=Mycobacterium paragordonae TaxID=1389713 RepID=A0A4R5WKF2_9MYCO|nr:TetR/AcrR family transcriptional regulator [Mycobacterium paragordonae]MDP7737362.1 helix-turn-helix domain-containing protein [Mycobacterium paragordonae]TDK91388.1 TetR/AcrR family transcriptional regulator [Mycobacterium paragordonae]TDL06902.1 TetR/AcrR family transcriptional regulator [Mycobacterium paragordonae]